MYTLGYTKGTGEDSICYFILGATYINYSCLSRANKNTFRVNHHIPKLEVSGHETQHQEHRLRISEQKEHKMRCFKRQACVLRCMITCHSEKLLVDIF